MTLRRFLRTVPHLSKRFFGHLRARPLTPVEQDRVNGLLREIERPLFWALAVPDQRHSHDAAVAISALRPDDRVAARAMLLHDVGKAHSRLGVVARSLATIGDAAGVALPASWGRYRSHGPLGAADLHAVDAESEIVLFAAHHGGDRPAGIDHDLWNTLRAADDA